MFEVFPNKFLYFLLAAFLTLGVTLAVGRAAAPPATTVWEGASGPAMVRPGETFALRVRLRNTGAALWEADGPARVVVTAMVVDGNGSPWPAPESRARLAYPVPPQAATTCVLHITAPTAPGRYRALVGRATVRKGALELDPAPFAWTFEVERG